MKTISILSHGLSLLVFSLGAMGCYFSNPPSGPHGHIAQDIGQSSQLQISATPTRLRSSRVIILGRFDSIGTQPIGGEYDFDEYQVSPLYRTYFFRHAPLELFEHTCDSLRASGLDVRKDYGTTGDPSLIEAPLRTLRPLVVRTNIVALQHDQIRTESDPPTDNEIARLIVDVSVFDTNGQRRYSARHTVSGHIAFQEDADMLRLLGLKLGEQLVKDARFLQAIEASAGGAS